MKETSAELGHVRETDKFTEVNVSVLQLAFIFGFCQLISPEKKL